MPIWEEDVIFGEQYELRGEKFVAGLQEGRQQGLARGIDLGKRFMARRLIEKRFGPMPYRATWRIESLDISDIHKLMLRIFDVKAIKELFAGAPASRFSRK